MNTTTLPAGSYSVLNPATYTSQTWDVTATEVRVFTAQAGVYTPVFLSTMTHEEAVELLARADRLGFSAPTFTPTTLGKPRACALHRLLARLGLSDHYDVAARALGREVLSLAALTEQDARRVWAYVVSQFPHARELAA